MVSNTLIEIFFDGGIKHINANPLIAETYTEIYWGYQVWRNRSIIHQERGYNSSDEWIHYSNKNGLPIKKTNNEAEYIALLNSLYYISKAIQSETQLPRNISIYGDSKLVIEQTKENWKVKAKNLIPFNKICKSQLNYLLEIGYIVSLNHVPRTEDKQKLVDKFARSSNSMYN